MLAFGLSNKRDEPSKEGADDPISKINIETYVCEFFVAFAKQAGNMFGEIAKHLDGDDQAILKAILT